MTPPGGRRPGAARRADGPEAAVCAGRALRVALRGAAAAGLVTLVVGLSPPVPASAFSGTRLAVRNAAMQEVGRTFADPAGDVAMVRGAWSVAGARAAAPIDAALAAQAAPGDAALGVAKTLCALDDSPLTIDVGVQAGDLVLYRDGADTARLALVLDGEELLVVDPATSRARRVPAQAVLGDNRARVGDLPGLAASPGTPCRVTPSVVPAVNDDAGRPGEVSLIDPAASSERIQYAAQHPRDGDTSFLHGLVGGAESLLRPLLGALGWVAGHLPLIGQGIDWLQDHTPLWAQLLIPGVPMVLLLKKLLGATVDTRVLRQVLLVLLAPVLALPYAVAALVMGVIGKATGRWSFEDAARVAARVYVATTSFAILVLTGVDGQKRTPVFGIVISLVTDVLFLAKPLGAALAVARLAPLAAARPALRWALAPLRWAGDAADVLGAKTSALARMVWKGSAVPLHTASDRVVAGRILLRAGDFLNLWRGPTSLAIDAISHGAAGLERVSAVGADLERSLAARSLTVRQVARALARLDPPTRELIEAAVPALRILSTGSHLRTGAGFMAGALGHASPPHIPQVPAPVSAPGTDLAWLTELERAVSTGLADPP